MVNGHIDLNLLELSFLACFFVSANLSVTLSGEIWKKEIINENLKALSNVI